MNPRLDSLLRQREVIREHLRWLETEIETAKSASSIAGSVTAALAPNPPFPARAGTPQGTSVEVWARSSGSSETAAETATTEDVPDEVDVRGVHHEVRRGCMLYLAIATTVLGLIVAFIYWRY
ncbi:MAG: hypothetical protein ACREIA_04335 [Opitutaceae bacterium]